MGATAEPSDRREQHEPFSKLPLASAALTPQLSDVVEYRKSGLSLNHVIGCPLDCAYCVRHLFDNFAMKHPHILMSDQRAVDALVGHWAFRAGTTPIQLFNRATDPFLPNVKEHLHRTLQLLDDRGFTNHTLVISRWRVEADDVARLERLRNLRVTVLITWSGIDDGRIEPVDGGIAAASLEMLRRNARRTRRILYWRPLVSGLNDSDDHIDRARRLAALADATVFTGLFHRDHIRGYLRSIGIPDLYLDTPRRKIMPRELERRVIDGFGPAPLFRKTSCAVAFAHGTADFNGHFGIERICDICPTRQLSICAAAHRRPDRDTVDGLARQAGLVTDGLGIGSGHVSVKDSTEQQRYFMQHSLGFQVHDEAHPHLPGRHGRAEEGWE